MIADPRLCCSTPVARWWSSMPPLVGAPRPPGRRCAATGSGHRGSLPGHGRALRSALRRAGPPLGMVDRGFSTCAVSLPPRQSSTLWTRGGGCGITHCPARWTQCAVSPLGASGLRSSPTPTDGRRGVGYSRLRRFVRDGCGLSPSGVSKPDPRIFAIALQRLGVPAASTWYVGDSPHHDLGGASAAGLAQIVLVDPLGLHQPRVGDDRVGSYQPRLAWWRCG